MERTSMVCKSIGTFSRSVLSYRATQTEKHPVVPLFLPQGISHGIWRVNNGLDDIPLIAGSSFSHPRPHGVGRFNPNVHCCCPAGEKLKQYRNTRAFAGALFPSAGNLLCRRSFGTPLELDYDSDGALCHASHRAVTIGDDALRRMLWGSDEACVQQGSTNTGPSDHGNHNLNFVSDESKCSQTDELKCSQTDDLAMLFKDIFEPDQSTKSALLINSTLFPSAAVAFQNHFLAACTDEVKQRLQELEPSEVKGRVIFPVFLEFCTQVYSKEWARFQALVHAADMTKPHVSFPLARAIKRKFVYHYGPTNSGKTFNALQKFLQASNGIYCGPLRLLAMEVYNKANAEGVLCSLHTGQERKDILDAQHVSCTVEMASMQQLWEVAVIDEIQLLNDDDRGWAWTRALLGLQAKEIHLCGDPSALATVRNICFATGDELTERSYERFKPLAVDTASLSGSFANAQPGDCFVAFSRREIFDIKRAVERATRRRCCVVYGALPPETRAQQAKLFNEPGSCYHILVASDAVGMGLNLNIRRVVFYSLEKFDGELRKPVPVSLVKQIAGRAGRRGSLYPEGLVTTFHPSDLPYLVSCLEQPFPETCNAGLFPSYEHMQLFAAHMPNAKFSELLEQFADTCRVDDYYFLCQNKGLRKVASVIDTVKDLTLAERFIFCFSPVNARNSKSIGALIQYATAYSKKLPLQLLVRPPSASIQIDFQLMDMEENYQLLSLYLWLSEHLSAEYFTQKMEAEKLSAEIADHLGRSLADLRA